MLADWVLAKHGIELDDEFGSASIDAAPQTRSGGRLCAPDPRTAAFLSSKPNGGSVELAIVAATAGGLSVRPALRWQAHLDEPSPQRNPERALPALQCLEKHLKPGRQKPARGVDCVNEYLRRGPFREQADRVLLLRSARRKMLRGGTRCRGRGM